MTKTLAKDLRAKAERAAEWVAREHFGCIHTRRAVKTRFNKTDFFGADIIGLRNDGTKIWVQVTAGQDAAVSQRRKKLEKYTWHETDSVYVWQLRETPNPANRRRMLYHFRLCELMPDGSWVNWDSAILIRREWFKAWREEA